VPVRSTPSRSDLADNLSRESPLEKNSQNSSSNSAENGLFHKHGGGGGFGSGLSQRSDSNASDFRPFGAKTGLDEGPPEFRYFPGLLGRPAPRATPAFAFASPGQKWLWKDPKEMAEDPNATPGSVKPNTLTLNTNLNTPTPHGMFSAGGGSLPLFGAPGSAPQPFGAGSAFQPPFGAGNFGAAAGQPPAGWLGQPPSHPHQQQPQLVQSLFGAGAGMPAKMGGAADDFKIKVSCTHRGMTECGRARERPLAAAGRRLFRHVALRLGSAGGLRAHAAVERPGPWPVWRAPAHDEAAVQRAQRLRAVRRRWRRPAAAALHRAHHHQL